MVSVVQAIRECNNLTVKELSEMFGISRQAVDSCEQCGRYAVSTIRRYSFLFGIEIEKLYEWCDLVKKGKTREEIICEYLEYTRKNPSKVYNKCNILKAIRIYEGCTPKEIGEKIGKNAVWVCGKEQNDSRITVSLIDVYCAGLNIKKSHFVHLFETKNAEKSPTDIMWLYSKIKCNN